MNKIAKRLEAIDKEIKSTTNMKDSTSSDLYWSYYNDIIVSLEIERDIINRTVKEFQEGI